MVAFLLTPIVFVVTLVIALVWSRLGLIAIVASLPYPAWYYAHTPPRDPQHALVPLNAEERALIRSRRFDVQVGVDGGTFPPIYRTRLIDDLGRTGLFTAVAAARDTQSADLIASVTGTYYGDKAGHSFLAMAPAAGATCEREGVALMTLMPRACLDEAADVSPRGSW
jgi:hypothetical protein